MKAKIKIQNNKEQADAVNAGHKKEVLNKQLRNDIKKSAIILSVVINAYLLVGLAVIQATSRYDAALIAFLQNT
ncbi:MAG: hypothetical protein PVI21_05035 [Candidatus Woesebacteria bacterium]|jgi:hypothetical protein